MKLKNNICSFRTLTLLLVWIYMLDLNLQGYRSAVEALGIKDTFAILPFVQTDGYFTKVMLVGVLCFFSNAPFMNRAEMYVMIRTGRAGWGRRNIGYIFFSSALLAFILDIISILMILPAVNWSISWGSAYKTLAVDGGTLGFQILDEAMNTYTPLQLMLLIFLVDSLAFAVMGMLLYTLSLHISRVWSYFITFGCVFLTTMEAFIPFSVIYYSPFSWIDPKKWRYGTMLDKPNLIYIFTAYVFLLFILILVSQKRIRTVEWNANEE